MFCFQKPLECFNATKQKKSDYERGKIRLEKFWISRSFEIWMAPELNALLIDSKLEVFLNLKPTIWFGCNTFYDIEAPDQKISFCAL